MKRFFRNPVKRLEKEAAFTRTSGITPIGHFVDGAHFSTAWNGGQYWLVGATFPFQTVAHSR